MMWAMTVTWSSEYVNSYTILYHVNAVTQSIQIQLRPAKYELVFDLLIYLMKTLPLAKMFL